MVGLIIYDLTNIYFSFMRTDGAPHQSIGLIKLVLMSLLLCVVHNFYASTWLSRQTVQVQRTADHGTDYWQFHTVLKILIIRRDVSVTQKCSIGCRRILFDPRGGLL